MLALLTMGAFYYHGRFVPVEYMALEGRSLAAGAAPVLVRYLGTNMVDILIDYVVIAFGTMLRSPPSGISILSQLSHRTWIRGGGFNNVMDEEAGKKLGGLQQALQVFFRVYDDVNT